MDCIYLFSPIPPMRTGTADYFDAVVQELACYPVDRSRIAIVVDGACAPARVLSTDYLGFRVLAQQQLPAVAQPGCAHVYFLANNEHHGYCFQRLAAVEALPGSRIVSVIHEPSCFMVMNSLAANRQRLLTDEDLIAAMRHQFGARAAFVLEARRAGQLPFDVEYLISAMGPALAKSHEVWTHNAFSALKLQLESGAGLTPPIVVSEHPAHRAPLDDAPLSGAHAKPPDTRRIGVFGWVNPCKRVDTILRAFALALQTAPTCRRERVEMVVAGQLPDPRTFDPQGLAASLGASDRVRFLNYVDLATFDQLIASCDLIMNLRFPSCGESSGPLERAAALGIPAVVSAYQAFGEIAGGVHISPLWPAETLTLYALFCQLIHGSGPVAPPPAGRARRPPVSRLIVDLLDGPP